MIAIAAMCCVAVAVPFLFVSLLPSQTEDTTLMTVGDSSPRPPRRYVESPRRLRIAWRAYDASARIDAAQEAIARASACRGS